MVNMSPEYKDYYRRIEEANHAIRMMSEYSWGVRERAVELVGRKGFELDDLYMARVFYPSGSEAVDLDSVLIVVGQERKRSGFLGLGEKSEKQLYYVIGGTTHSSPDWDNYFPKLGEDFHPDEIAIPFGHPDGGRFEMIRFNMSQDFGPIISHPYYPGHADVGFVRGSRGVHKLHTSDDGTDTALYVDVFDLEEVSGIQEIRDPGIVRDERLERVIEWAGKLDVLTPIFEQAMEIMAPRPYIGEVVETGRSGMSKLD